MQATINQRLMHMPAYYVIMKRQTQAHKRTSTRKFRSFQMKGVLLNPHLTSLSPSIPSSVATQLNLRCKSFISHSVVRGISSVVVKYAAISHQLHPSASSVLFASVVASAVAAPALGGAVSSAVVVVVARTSSGISPFITSSISTPPTSLENPR